MAVAVSRPAGPAAGSRGPYRTVWSRSPHGAVWSTGPYGAVRSTGPYGAVRSTGPYGAVRSTGPYGALAAALLLPLLLLLSVAGCHRRPQAFDFSGYSLLLITVDTLRADRLGAYGYPGAETPHLDRLAAEGVRFENVYSPVPLTLPSHATLFTGRYPFSIGVRTNGSYLVPESEITLAERFRDAGFSTFAAVAAFVVASKFGLAQGFDTYDDSLGSTDLFHAFESEIRAPRVYDKFRSWLGGHDGRRFLAWVHFYDPHLPYEPPAPYLERFAGEPYNGEIAYVDAHVGKIVDDLAGRGLLERTLVVVVADHGEAFGEHGEEGHGLLCYEETIRVPLILYAPGQLKAGRVVSERLRLMDLMPTLLELFAVDPPAGVEGASFAPALRGEAEPGPRTAYFESLAGPEFKNWAPLHGLISDRHKYIALPAPELYDLESDPGERRNLYRREPQLAEKLQQELDALLLEAAVEAGETGTAARRDLEPEDVRRLRALGYLSTSGSSVTEGLDPKLGIAIEMRLRAIRKTIQVGELERAERELRAVIAENPGLEMPDLYDLHHSLARSRGEEAEAIAQLEQGLARFPELEAFRFKLALYLFEIGRYDDAERVVHGLLEVRPEHSQGMVLLGRVAEIRGDLGGALSRFERAASLEPHSVPLRSRIADLLARTGREQEALAIYEALLAGSALESDAEKLYKAAMLFVRAGKLERGEELFRRGLELEPAGVHHLSFALLLSRTGKLDEAIAQLELALERYGTELTPQQAQMATAALGQWRRAR